MDGLCRPIGQKGAPMYAVLKSFGLKGLNGFPVEVEADISGGMPALSIVGLPDSAVRESGDRVHAALKNLGFKWPDRRITINLAPADVRKTGRHLRGRDDAQAQPRAASPDGSADRGVYETARSRRRGIPLRRRCHAPRLRLGSAGINEKGSLV